MTARDLDSPEFLDRLRRREREAIAAVVDAHLAAIARCLDAAPNRQRMAFTLREVEGLPTEEICKILDVTVTNLGVILHRTRSRPRECLEAKGIDP